MNWFRRLVRRFALRAAKYAGIPLRDPALVAMLGNQPTAAGVDVDEIAALNYSAVWAAVNCLASGVASLPPVPYRRVKGGHREAWEMPAWKLLLISPNPEMSPYTFHETLQAHALTWGNAYAELNREHPEEIATEATLLLPNQTEPMRDEETGELYYQFKALYAGERDRRIPWWKILHIPGPSFDGLKGYSVIQQARESIGLGVAAEKFGGSLFGRGCIPGGILELAPDAGMTEKAKKNLRESFELLHRGPDNAHRIAVLEDGHKFSPYTIPPEDAQYLQTRQFQVIEVARWFNVPPHKIRDLTHATFSNIEEQNLDFLQDSLRPWLVRREQEYARKLFGPVDQDEYFVRHDTHNLLMADINKRYDAYAKGRNGGWLTLNDILRREGMNPLPPDVGDCRLAPSTMKELGHADPIDPAALNAALTLAASLSPATPELIRAVLCGVVPQAGEDLINRLAVKIAAGWTPPAPPPAPAKRVKDAEGHEHAADGKFGSGGGGKTLSEKLPATHAELEKKADTAADTWVEKLKSLPAKIAGKAKETLNRKYEQLSNRYGSRMAKAIIGVGIVGIPIPAPGASLILAAPLLAAGELWRKWKGERAEEDGPDMEHVHTAAEEFWKETMKEWADEHADD